MDALTFITECLTRGLNISLLDGKVHVEADSQLKPATADFIRQHKPEIIQSLKPVWSGGDAESGSCHQCGKITSAMVTRPDVFAGWCCLECFDKRAANAMADDIREKAKANQGQRNDIPQKSAKSKPIDTRAEIAKTAGVSHNTVGVNHG